MVGGGGGGGCRNRTISDEKNGYIPNERHTVNAFSLFSQCNTDTWILYFILKGTRFNVDDVVRMSLFTVDPVYHTHTHTRTNHEYMCDSQYVNGTKHTTLQTDHCHRYRSVYVFGYFWFLHHLHICSACAGKTRHAACIAITETTYLFTTPSNQWHFFALFLPVFGICGRANTHTLTHTVVNTRRINFLRLSRATRRNREQRKRYITCVYRISTTPNWISYIHLEQRMLTARGYLVCACVCVCGMHLRIFLARRIWNGDVGTSVLCWLFTQWTFFTCGTRSLWLISFHPSVGTSSSRQCFAVVWQLKHVVVFGSCFLPNLKNVLLNDSLGHRVEINTDTNYVRFALRHHLDS